LATSLPIMAKDDEAEQREANEPASRAKQPRAARFSERLAMAKPDGPLSPKPTLRALDADTITLLMKRGEQLVEAGDFAAARTLFQRAAEADDAAAAIALGATYDPTVLSGLRAIGIDADVGKARFWYQKAVTLGSSDGKRRLELLANRLANR
jgi:TPR repeat protein